MAFEDRYFYRLHDVVVSPKSGLSWLPSGRILGESYGSLIRLLGWGASVDEVIIPQKHRVSGPIVVIPDTGYYHWLLESLPAALHSLREAPDATILIPSNPPPYLEDAIQIVAPRNRVIRSSSPVWAEQFVLTAIEPSSGFVPPEDVVILKQTFLPPTEESASRNIYVSRRGSTRSPANESELEDALQNIGFEVIRAEQLKFGEQVDLFRSTAFVVGVHGAGLANIVWSPSLKGLVEVISLAHFNDCFARLAVSQDAQYDWIPSRPVLGDGEVIDIEATVRLVEKVLRTAD